MKKTVLVTLIFAFLSVGCTVGFLGGPRGDSLVIVPALPLVVEMDANQPYYQNGYYYDYRGDVWMYSESNQGPWNPLPRDRYPKEVHYRGQDKREHDNR